jgi:hypothetical protein
MPKAKLVVIEPFEAYETMEGDVIWFPFSFKTPEGRTFSLFPHHGLLDLINWFRKGHLVVDMMDKRTGELLLGSMDRLE